MRRCSRLSGGSSVNRVVVVTGVPGVGKSTVVAGALRKLKERGMLELFKLEGVKDQNREREIAEALEEMVAALE